MSDRRQVLIILGSKSDEDMMKGCPAMLESFGIGYKQIISSAHRNPEKTSKLAAGAQAEGFKVIIAAAGMAAALPGVVASQTALPVIGVPMPGSALSGVDALYSIVQMPAGVPVACMAVGGHGAKNAAIFAARIIALEDQAVARKLKQYYSELAQD